jgi:hypothetical protein
MTPVVSGIAVAVDGNRIPVMPISAVPGIHSSRRQVVLGGNRAGLILAREASVSSHVGAGDRGAI